MEDKETPLRVCVDAQLGYPTNVEYKLCDACCNIYLALACVLSCGIEGISRNLTLRSMMGTSSDASNTDVRLGPDFKSALDCLRKDSLLLTVLGEKLGKGYFAVKNAEIKLSEKLTLEEEVNLALKKS